jgi:2-oxo-4-hydroxy-4-carboxy--5-ureidoimidazoline (OHCU) decarboxylase
MQMLMGLYMTPGARLLIMNDKELSLFIQSYLTQRGISSFCPSFTDMVPELNKVIVDKFGMMYSVGFTDMDRNDEADEFSDRVSMYVNADVPSLGVH